MNIDLAQLIPQLGIASIFMAAAYKLYNDLRQDSLRREEQMRQDSSTREEKLMTHLAQVADTLEKINERLMVVEKSITREGEPK